MSNKKILIVDDEPNNLQVLRGILSSEGYKLAYAKDGESALARVGQHAPDLILLDIMMQGIDGYEVCRRLKADPILAKIPVIFVTAMDDIDDETKGFDVGAVDYITKPVSAPTVLARVRTHLKLVRMDDFTALAGESIMMLGRAGHYNDTDTGVHIWRMAAYTRAIAEAAGWTGERLNMLELAAPMHDTGKIGIPDEILKAPRKLTKDEWKIMKTHSQVGHDILSMAHHPVFTMAAEIALGHHEHWDGSGYPNGLVGESIPESARIITIADVFDALTVKRPYKEAWSIEDALEEIRRSAGFQFDQRLVELFLAIEDTIRQLKKQWDEVEQSGSPLQPVMH